MIAAILGAIASMAGFTVFSIGEQEIRESLGRMSRSNLNNLYARLQNIRTRSLNRQNQIAEVLSALQATGMNISSASTASKVRADRSNRKAKLNAERKELQRLDQDVDLEQALVDQKIVDSSTYGGAIKELRSPSKLSQNIQKWEDKI